MRANDWTFIVFAAVVLSIATAFYDINPSGTTEIVQTIIIGAAFGLVLAGILIAAQRRGLI